MENPIKLDDLGVPLFSETSIYTSISKDWSHKNHWNLKVTNADPHPPTKKIQAPKVRQDTMVVDNPMFECHSPHPNALENTPS